jgi:hypothetical protein
MTIPYERMIRANQTTCSLAEIVFEKPLSGEFEEVLFGSDRGNTLWIKFSDLGGLNEWIGKFGVGGLGAGRVTKVEEPDRFLISAGGFAYLVDATDRKLISQFCDQDACDIAYDFKRKMLIVADYTKLSWIEFGQQVSFSRKISVDGIYDLKVEGNILTGLAIADYGGDEKRFKFDLDTLKILGRENVSTKKPWWQFW